MGESLGLVLHVPCESFPLFISCFVQFHLLKTRLCSHQTPRQKPRRQLHEGAALSGPVIPIRDDPPNKHTRLAINPIPEHQVS
jgi:hypothetical protein